MNDLLARYPWILTLLYLTGLLLICWLLDRVVRRWALRLMSGLASRTRTRWDDMLFNEGVFNHLSHMVPVALAQLALPLVPGLPVDLVTVGRNVLTAYMVLLAAMAGSAALSASHLIYLSSEDRESVRPVKSYVQLAKIVLFLISGVLIVSVLIERSPLLLLSGLGAMTAVLLLVFKDTLLSLVASVQIASNDMVRVGDWIEMPQLSADGDVIDIALHTVKVQNWDKTITTIPTHRLISDSFRNWRGMSESGGRRIKRSLLIDLASVRFLDPDQIERLQKLSLLAPYLADKQRELAQWNAGVSADAPENGRRLTNLGTFRAYAYRYIQAHPGVRADMTRLVRALDPGPQGQPVEIYCFTNTTNWAEHERIKGDIFDHLIATLPSFGLRLYQQPSGGDLQAWLPSEARPDHNADGHATASGEGEHR
ncbi:MAG: mechanosensitive ion channel [Lysobacterales bacterium]